MNKKLIPSFFFILFITAGLCLAESKVITLKDGSQIKGKIISLSEGIYTVANPQIGEMRINDADILSIRSPQAPSTPERGNSSLKNQVQQAQNVLTHDPDLMREVMNLMQDEEIMRLLQDPALIQAVQGMDEKQIKNDPNIQQLIDNPRMKKLMEKVRDRLPPQQ